ncbi:hypothetical protein EWM64_g4230 [Hericium alpestre]|uniref:HD domain-containing protein n=1 Tax=Hericium alpestre TaxID=135208 RepID=A0A4Y9ZZZ0_9AGAM|nr:hypothetical protein EWM64_g4230 [Hericium alpestre]
MTFPVEVDAFVPRDFKEFSLRSKIRPAYISLSTLQSLPLDAKHAASREYALKIVEPSLYRHSERCYLFALAIAANGFPSGTPDVPQIPFAEFQDRLFHATILHDLGRMLAYEHLLHMDASIDPERLGDIVQSIMTHTLMLPRGSMTAVGMLLQLGAAFDMLGWDAFGEGSLNFLLNRETVYEIETAYPRGEQGHQVKEFVDKMTQEKPHCLILAGIPDLANRVAAINQLVVD